MFAYLIFYLFYYFYFYFSGKLINKNRYTKEKPMELMGSEEYKKLHNETPKIAMQLHAIFISFANVDEIDKMGLDWIKDLGNRTN